MESDDRDLDCAICLQKYHHPAQLPCGHVFCFLCVKGITLLSKKCAICRTQIPLEYLDQPVLLNNVNTEEILEPENDKYQWYYEGRNGWWKYDERSNMDLEAAFNSSETECLLLLAGTLYCVDFQNKIQYRRNDHTKRRRVKRDLPALPSKGIAGIKIINTRETEDLENIRYLSTNGEDEGIVVENINNSQNTNTTDADSFHTIDDLTNRLSNINLQREEQSENGEEVVLENGSV